ncbi:hypothetical protein [Castellaniella sp.]|uniref:4'-phosphopantetheinyl transferase family protein n=1 Tax=Castellaniella sp. TaxID=1955812 RepID=UPI002AFF0A12|nr:hypothetical protein [Castellaniella sp.]
MPDICIVALRGLPDEAQAQRLRQDLPQAEQHWITRLHRPQDRLRSLLGRALVRRLLAQRLGAPPAHIALNTGPHGKPQLSALAGAAPVWHFNIAHSGDQVLAAIGPQPLGVDVEACPDTIDAALLQMVMGRRAADRSPDLDPRAFCTEWVQREAVLKACGLGLMITPGQLRLHAGGHGWRSVSGPPATDGLYVRLLWASSTDCAALCLPAPTPAWQLSQWDLAAWLDASEPST